MTDTPTSQEQSLCADGQHDYFDDYYGVRCRKCPLFYPYGSEPWAVADVDEDDFDEDFDDEDPGDECGRWRNGVLTKSCSKAGSEECDFECPYRGSL